MSKGLKTVILVLTGMLALLVIGVFFLNPIRRSEAGIEAWLFELTPRGSSFQEVRAYAEQRGWFDSNQVDINILISNSFLRGELGSYLSIPFSTHVTAFWEFDSSNRLTRIRIWKTMDGL